MENMTGGLTPRHSMGIGPATVGSTLANASVNPKVSVQNLLEQQFGDIASLSDAINELEMRLSPVLDSVPPSAGSDSAKEPGAPNIARVLDTHNAHISYAAVRIRNIISRLHV